METGFYKKTEDCRDRPVRGEIRFRIDHPEKIHRCPKCGILCKVYQKKERTYSHPRMVGMAVTIVVRVPKLRCDSYPIQLRTI